MAVDQIQETGVWGVNENGAVVLQADTSGTGNVVGSISSSQVPQDITSNKMVVKFPESVATLKTNATEDTTIKGVVQIPLGNSPFSGYVAMIPGVQAATSGSAKSLAGSTLAEAYPSALLGRGNLTDAQMWANAGYMSSNAAAGGQFEIPLSAYAPNLHDGQGQFLAFTVNAAAPGANTGLVSQANGATNLQGFAITALTTGKLAIAAITAAGAFSLGNSIATVCDSTDHKVALFLHPSGYGCLWVDGEIDIVYAINPSVPVGISTPTSPLTFGVSSTVATNGGTAMAAKFKGVHLISFGTLPLNLNQIVKKIATDPLTPLRNSDVVLASKTVLLYWGAGQSNEAGAGNTAGVVGPYGVPDRDAYAAGRSIKTGLAKALSKRGVAALWGNSAFGSTSISDAWCGRIRNWATNSNVGTGTYMLSGGVVYKCTNTFMFNGVSTVAPAAGTGADSITWTSLGAPTADDLAALAGTGVYSSSSARWDPNGLLAAAVGRVQQALSTTSDRVALISLGQGDRYVGTSRAAYADAMQKVTLYHLANGATKVLLCMTVRTSVATNYSTFNGGGVANSDNDTANHWYDRQLLPGRADALLALSSNSSVFAGWDWANGIGAVTNQTSPTGIGVKSTDSVHMTDATYESRAVPLVDAALISAGI